MTELFKQKHTNNENRESTIVSREIENCDKQMRVEEDSGQMREGAKE